MATPMVTRRKISRMTSQPTDARLAPRAMRTADFIGAARDHVGHQTVNANAGEKDGEQTEESGELGDEALMGDGTGDLLVERGKAGDGEVGVDGVDSALDGGGDGGGVAGVADNEITEDTDGAAGRKCSRAFAGFRRGSGI